MENIEMIEKVQLRFLKLLLGVKATTPSCMIYGELGIYPLLVDVKIRLLTFWFKLVKDYLQGSNKISNLMFRLGMQIEENNQPTQAWLKFVKITLENLGLGYIWNDPLLDLTITKFKSIITERITDQYKQNWKEEIDRNNICISYRLFKTEFGFESYLANLLPSLRRNYLKFRLSAHRLPIQQLRYIDIPRHERLCTVCDLEEVGDEFHYIFNCNNQDISQNRKELLPKYYQKHSNVIKMHQLFNTKSKRKLINLCKYITVILNVAC